MVEALLILAEAELDPAKAEATTAFLGALTILLREGIEALLVVGMIAFLRKSGRPEVLAVRTPAGSVRWRPAA